MGKLDAIGRATFHHIAAQGGVWPTNREVRWLKHIQRHGPQASVYLYELTKDTHRCKDTALRDLQKLRAGGFLFLPPQQRATERAEFNPYIYDMTPKAKRWLQDCGLAEPTVRPTGHWWHAYMVSCVTSSIDVAAAREGVRYIPAHEIRARKGATLGIPVDGKMLIPDQLFALDYGGSYRAFVLEVDRGTEPSVSPQGRRSIYSMLETYQKALLADALRAQYLLQSQPILVIVVESAERQSTFKELMGKRFSTIANRCIFGMFDRPGTLSSLSLSPLVFRRHNGDAFFLNNACREKRDRSDEESGVR